MARSTLSSSAAANPELAFQISPQTREQLLPGVAQPAGDGGLVHLIDGAHLRQAEPVDVVEAEHGTRALLELAERVPQAFGERLPVAMLEELELRNPGAGPQSPPVRRPLGAPGFGRSRAGG